MRGKNDLIVCSEVLMLLIKFRLILRCVIESEGCVSNAALQVNAVRV